MVLSMVYPTHMCQISHKNRLSSHSSQDYWSIPVHRIWKCHSTFIALLFRWVRHHSLRESPRIFHWDLILSMVQLFCLECPNFSLRYYLHFRNHLHYMYLKPLKDFLPVTSLWLLLDLNIFGVNLWVPFVPSSALTLPFTFIAIFIRLQIVVCQRWEDP